MSVLKDITDTLEVVTKSIKTIKEIHTAVQSGVNYLKVNHPNVKDDLKAMAIELQKNCNAIAKSSAIITHFKFNGSPQAIQNEPTRFNEHYKTYKINSSYAENELLSLKGSCGKIKTHIEKYDAGTKKTIFTFLGLHDKQKEEELHDCLQKIYNDELDFHNNVYQMAKAITDAVNHVSNTLELNYMMDYNLVPQASKLLSEYASHFSELEILATRTKTDLEYLIETLSQT